MTRRQGGPADAGARPAGAAGPALDDRIAEHLDVLCERVGGRLVGTAGNRAATDYVRDTLVELGLTVDCPDFACLEWRQGEVRLEAGGEACPAHPGPYSPPFDGTAELAAAASLAELDAADIEGRIVLLHGDLAKEPLAPRNYVFYNPEAHQAVYRLLDEKRPAAVLGATGTCPSTAGAAYPFALFDDGDLDLPSAYLKDVDGARLLTHVGEPARLLIDSQCLPSTGCNVIGAWPPHAGEAAIPDPPGAPARRIVLTAHVDARPGTPGALDNAAGVATMLAVAELLARTPPARAGTAQGGAAVTGAATGAGASIELAILNGEDYYAASGEMAYIAANEGHWADIALAINVDGAGYREGATAASFYSGSDELRRACEAALAPFPGVVPGEPWVQGDHSLFVMQGVPALAFTSDQMTRLWSEIAHTERDRLELIDPARLDELARALVACVAALA